MILFKLAFTGFSFLRIVCFVIVSTSLLANAAAKEVKSFALKDRDWPVNVGDATVSLWKDDALAAITLTIDDNCAPDHAWWLEMAKKYDLRLTWFIITARVDSSNSSFFGTWDAFRRLQVAGHDVQSHSVLHLAIDDPRWQDVETEYRESQKIINENIPEGRCLVLAYPGGPNQKMNDSLLAAKYYIGARGVVGTINAANTVNYMRTGSLGDIHIGDAKWPSQEFNSLYNPESPFYRGWYSALYHNLGTPEKREAIEPKLAELQQKAKAGDLWIATFAEVCQYGQERDVAKLEVGEKSEDKICFTLTTSLVDARFDYPLTVKVRANPSWKTIKAEQAGQPLVAKLVEYEGAVFALVNTVPNRGEAILTP